ncbi:MAG: hypothetical protein EB015_15245 [Methylocystaceae bacterium]|nr:hypothetical protein [Methylocystaceae bacterium]
MAVIDLAFEKLKSLKLAKTTNDYSERWLGMEISYYRCLTSKRRRASARVYGQLAKRLMDEAAARRINGQCQDAREIGDLASACINAIIYTNDNDYTSREPVSRAHS